MDSLLSKDCSLPSIFRSTSVAGLRIAFNITTNCNFLYIATAKQTHECFGKKRVNQLTILLMSFGEIISENQDLLS